MDNVFYLMESDSEALRLDVKTDKAAVAWQAEWAGIKKGYRVADVGCGIGKTSFFLHELVQPEGEVVGIDASKARIDHARKCYLKEGLSFVCRDFCQSLEDLGYFDFIWVRFVLEYHKSKAFEIVKNLTNILKPGGILCLIDLDHNCLNHYGAPPRFMKALKNLAEIVEDRGDFDPYIGRKLYSFLYDLNYQEIDLTMAAHHLIYGEINGVDYFNFEKKIEVVISKIGYKFPEYQGGQTEFLDEFKRYMKDQRRFVYTPLIACRGVKPNTKENIE